MSPVMRIMVVCFLSCITQSIQAQKLYPDSAFRVFFPNSDLVQMEGAYKHSKPEGTWRFYLMDTNDSVRRSSLYKQFTYRKGLLDGMYMSFSSNGIMTDSGTYAGNMKTGTWIQKGHDGKIIAVKNYRNGILHGFCQDPHMQGYFIDGKLDGKVFMTGSDKSRVIGHYRMDIREDRWEFTRPSGLIEIMHYAGDTLNGPYQSYNLAGKDTVNSTFGYYSNGQKEGLWTTSHFYNGKKYSVTYSSYVQGMLNGTVIELNGEGDTLQAITYKKSIKHGPEKKWHTNGKLRQLAIHGDSNVFYRFWDTAGRATGEFLDLERRPGEYYRTYSGSLIELDTFYIWKGQRKFDHYAWKEGILTEEYHLLEDRKDGRWYHKDHFDLVYRQDTIVKKTGNEEPGYKDDNWWANGRSYFLDYGPSDVPGMIGHAQFFTDEFCRTPAYLSRIKIATVNTASLEKWANYQRVVPADVLPAYSGDVVFKCYITADNVHCSPTLVKSLHPAYDMEALKAIMKIFASQHPKPVEPVLFYITVRF